MKIPKYYIRNMESNNLNYSYKYQELSSNYSKDYRGNYSFDINTKDKYTSDFITIETDLDNPVNETIEKVYGHSYTKNQLIGTLTESMTTHGLTITNNNDGSITLNGTTDSNITGYYVAVRGANPNFYNLAGHTLLLKCCPKGGGENKYNAHILVGDGADWSYGQPYDYGDGAIFQAKKTNGENSYVYGVRLFIYANQTFNNEVIRPKLVDLTLLDKSLANLTGLTPEMVLKKYPNILNWDYDLGTNVDAEDFDYESTGINFFDEITELGRIDGYNEPIP